MSTNRPVLRIHTHELAPAASEESWRGFTNISLVHTLVDSLWENSEVGMRLTDDRGFVVAVNSAFCTIVKRLAEEIVGRPFYDLGRNGHAEEAYKRMYRMSFRKAGAGPLLESDVKLSGEDGRGYDVESSLVKSEDGRVLLLSTFKRTARRGNDDTVSEPERQLRMAFDKIPDVLFVLDRNGAMKSVNPAFEKKTGWKADEWVGKSFRELLHPDDLAIAWRSFRDHLRGKEPHPVRLRVATKSGRYSTGEFSWSSLIEDGKIALILGVARDVTERIAEEERSTRERHLLRTLIDHLPDLIFFKDSEGRYLLSNQAHLRSLGLERLEEAVGKTTFDFNPAELAQQYHADEMKIVRTCKPILGREEWALHRDTGERRLHLTNKIPLQNHEGVVTGIVGISRDITDQKKIEEALLQSEAKYRSLFQNAVQPMFQTSLEGKLLNANNALLKLLGYENFFELVEIEVPSLYVRPEQRGEIKQVLESKGYISGMEIELKRKNGNIVTVLEYSRALKDEKGNITGFEGILEDITVRKALEQKLSHYLEALEQSQKEQVRLNAEKNRLFSVLSHDLRSPFGSILGFCEVLLTDGDNLSEAEKKQFVGYIKEGAEDQLALVNNLLDWSRFETGRVKMELKALTLDKIAGKSITGLLGTATKKGIKLTSTLTEDLAVQGDEQFLKQVFDNLLGNALKFTPAGGAISVDLINQNDSAIVVAIKDTGIGIPAEDISKLFKAEEKYTRKGLEGEKGTGLGLPVCREIMEKHGGSIEVESEPGRGTTFKLTFINGTPRVGVNILVVDDEEGSRVLHGRYIQRLLPKSNIIYASNGREAIEQALRLRPHAVVTDYAMPEMDGYELLTELKRYAETKNIPVIIITGDDSKASSETMRLAGAFAVLSKPVKLETLETEFRRGIIPQSEGTSASKAQ